MAQTFRQSVFCYKLFQGAFVVSLLFCQSSWGVLALSDLEGVVRLQAGLPVKMIPVCLSDCFSDHKNKNTFFMQARARVHVKGKFQFNNELKTQLDFLSSNAYEQSTSVKQNFKIYPTFSWLLNEDLELSFGRNIYENKFHQLVSINDYEPFFYTFDGMFLEYSTRILSVNFWGARLPGRWVGLKQIEEFEYGFGFFLDIESLSDYVENFNIHAAYLADSFFERQELKMSRYGLGLEGTIDPMNLAYTVVTVGHGEGVQFKWEENMYHFLLSYSWPFLPNSRIFVGYHTDSTKYQPWLYDRHKNAGLLDIFLWGNLTYYFFGFSGSVSDLFDFQILFYELSPTEKGPVQLAYLGALLEPGGRNAVNAKYNSFGRELDIQLKAETGENFEIHLLAGLFIPRSHFKELFGKTDFYNNIQMTGFYKF